MGLLGAIGLIAVAAAFAGASLAVRCAAERGRRRRTGRLPGNMVERDGSLARLLRNGVPGFSRVAQRVRAIGRVDRFSYAAAAVAGERGFSSNPNAALSACLVLLAICFVAGCAGAGTLVAGAALSACVAAVGTAWVRAQQERRVERMREAVPDVLQSMRSCFQSGLSLLQTLEHIASEAHGGVGALFARGAHALRTGGTASEALDPVRRAREVPELAFVAIALDVQHQAGGSMSRVLDAAREMAESELELARSMRVQTAQARLSARVVSVMPFVLVALFTLMSEDFLAPFFESATGVALLAVALCLQVAGVVAVRKTLRTGEDL